MVKDATTRITAEKTVVVADPKTEPNTGPAGPSVTKAMNRPK